MIEVQEQADTRTVFYSPMAGYMANISEPKQHFADGRMIDIPAKFVKFTRCNSVRTYHPDGGIANIVKWGRIETSDPDQLAWLRAKADDPQYPAVVDEPTYMDLTTPPEMKAKQALAEVSEKDRIIAEMRKKMAMLEEKFGKKTA